VCRIRCHCEKTWDSPAGYDEAAGGAFRRDGEGPGGGILEQPRIRRLRVKPVPPISGPTARIRGPSTASGKPGTGTGVMCMCSIGTLTVDHALAARTVKRFFVCDPRIGRSCEYFWAMGSTTPGDSGIQLVLRIRPLPSILIHSPLARRCF
jgi:hypothetical protein